MSGKGFRRPRTGRRAEQPAEGSPPDQRALDALGEAVRKARAASGMSAAPSPTTGAARGPLRPPAVIRSLPEAAVPASDRLRESPAAAFGGPAPPQHRVAAPPPGGLRLPPPRRRRSIPFGVPGGFSLALAVVALLVVVFVALRLAGIPGPSGSSSASRPPAHARSATTSSLRLPTTSQSTRPGPSSTVSTTAPSATTTSSTVSTTTTSSTPSTTTTPGSLPQLSSVSPSAAGAGTVVVVHGTNFFSRNGLVLARFGAQPARTDCPSQTMCMVTVPALPGSTSTVALTISTESGTSNALSFHYA